MKRHGNLFTQFSSFENLLSAYQLSRKGSRRNEENTTFFFHLEKELLLLQAELRSGTWQPQPYLRYMDDFVLFAADKTLLKEWRKEIESFLAQKLHLKLKPSATFINSRTNGLRFLGKRIFPGVIRLHVQHLRRITRRIQLRQREYIEGYIYEEKFLQSMGSYWGMLSVYALDGLRKALSSK